VPGETIHAIACHPLQPEVAIGFGDGKMRIFHVPSTSLVQEHQLHEQAVSQVKLLGSPCLGFSAWGMQIGNGQLTCTSKFLLARTSDVCVIDLR
jgi:hypothetical protein